MRNLDDWLALLENRRTIELGLQRVRKVWRTLNIATEKPVIMVGGTNGKGSVCALLDAILNAAGYRVGCYLSPHLRRFNERMRIGGEEISDAQLLPAFAAVEEARIVAGVQLTYFEFATLAALQLFEKCDCLVLEVGLGGRLDAVNIVEPAVSVVTNIGLDHMDYLGDTRDDIGREKAGILRRDKTAIIGDLNPPPGLLAAAKKTGAQLRLVGEHFAARQNGNEWSFGGRRQLKNLPFPALRGRHQLQNAACALAALESLPTEYWVGIGAIRKGLHRTHLAARGQVLAGLPTTVLDVAHNEGAATVLEQYLFEMGFFPQTRAVFGALARKNVDGMVRRLSPRVDAWYVAKPDGGDLSAGQLAATIEQAGGRAQVYDSIKQATAAVYADSEDNDRIVVTGSFLTVADFLQTRP